MINNHSKEEALKSAESICIIGKITLNQGPLQGVTLEVLKYLFKVRTVGWDLARVIHHHNLQSVSKL